VSDADEDINFAHPDFVGRNHMLTNYAVENECLTDKLSSLQIDARMGA
jgi:hypothetical protein